MAFGNLPDTEYERKMQATSKIAKPGLDKQHLMEEYKKWESSLSYDKVVCNRGYTGPKKTALCMAEQIAEANRSTFKILDVGAGTGLVGEALQQEGFGNIDALEPSQELLKTARGKNVYHNFFQCFMTEGVTPGISDGMYEGLVSCGCFMDNHLPVKSLDEMLRVVKPGGVIVITTRFKYLESAISLKGTLEPYMQHLEKEGKWTMVRREVFPKYYQEDHGIVWIFKTL